MKKRILLITAIVVITVALLSITGCAKKTTTTKTTTSVLTANEQRFKTIEQNATNQLDKLTALQTEVTKLKSGSDWQVYVNGIQASLQSKIDALTLDNTKLKTSLTETLSAQNKTVADKLVELDTKIAAAIAEMKTAIAKSLLPRAAIATDFGRRSIKIEVYGIGDYPVVVNLYGNNLKMGEIDIDDENSSISEEFLSGDYTLVATPQTINVSSSTITSGAAVPVDPNPHTHNVLISGLTIGDSIYSLVFNGKLLSVIIEPDTSWKDVNLINLDIRDISGTLFYVTANVGAN